MDYSSEHIDVPAYIDALNNAAPKAGFTIEEIGQADSFPLLALSRETATPKASVYISAGTHGDEPTGPLAVLKMLGNNCFHASTNWHVLPLLNPWGTAKHQRGNAKGKDINRDYKTPATPEAKAHVAWLRKTSRQYDAAICLHEDWEAKGYYIYELNLDHRTEITQGIMNAVDPIIGIDRSPVIEGYPATDGVIQPPTNISMRPDWPETIYLVEHHTRLGYTFETPCKPSLGIRIEAHISGINAVTNGLLRCKN